MKKKKQIKNKKITLMGKRYNLSFVPYLGNFDGHCDPPDCKNKSIRIHSGLKGKAELETLLHEFLHALDWTKDETWIEQSAEDMSVILWNLGWKKVKSSGKINKKKINE